MKEGVDAREEIKASLALRRLLAHHEHLVEEAIDGGLQGDQVLEG